MPMKGLRRNDDAMKNRSWYQKNYIICSVTILPQTTNHKPQTTNHQPPTTNHKPQTTNHKPQTPNSKPSQ